MPHPCARVLVVNDERDILDALADALRIEGADVETALGAQHALRIVDAGFAPTLVLTDLMMPGRHGEELIDELRRHPAVRDVPIVAMSASPAQLSRIDGKADGRLSKPFDLNTLYSTLASLC